MQSSSVPSKFQIPFANSAGSLYIRTVPKASQIGIQDGAASLTDGFPPKCFVPVASGGTPPFGADFNGLLNQITAWAQWQQAGAPIVYDATFQTAIGGYPMGAIIQIGAGGPEFMSTTENNAVAPSVGAAGWMPVTTFGGNVTTVSATGPLTASNAGLVLISAASGNVNITMPAVSSENGIPLPFCFVRTDNSVNTVTLTAAGGNTFWPSGASTFSVSALTSYEFSGDGSSAWRLIGGTYFALLNGSASQAFNVAPAAIGSTTQAVNQGQFSSSLGSNGWKEYPDPNSPTGFVIEQWGSQSSGNGSLITFPVPFPNACLNIQVSESNGNSGTWGVGVPTVHASSNKSKTGFTHWTLSWNAGSWAAASNSVDWRALGY